MIQIDVTQSDIDQAGDKCPIELAANRALRVEDAIVTTNGRLLPDPDTNWPLPGQARTFVRRYDAGRPVEPFSFRLAAALNRRQDDPVKESERA